jgi:hypothetical protein
MARDAVGPDGSDVRLLVSLKAGGMAHVCLTIPTGTCFQFRSFGNEPLTAIGITMPPSPGDAEAVGGGRSVAGKCSTVSQRPESAAVRADSVADARPLAVVRAVACRTP